MIATAAAARLEVFAGGLSWAHQLQQSATHVEKTHNLWKEKNLNLTLFLDQNPLLRTEWGEGERGGDRARGGGPTNSVLEKLDLLELDAKKDMRIAEAVMEGDLSLAHEGVEISEEVYSVLRRIVLQWDLRLV